MEAGRSNRPAHIPGDLSELRPILQASRDPLEGKVAKRFVRIVLGACKRVSPSLLKRKEILMLLKKFSLRRGAPVTPETLALYTEDLSNFEMNDIAEALDKFGTAEPEQYEAAFPCIGVFIRKVTSVENRRKPSSLPS